jgi:hypothetical protein
MSKKEKFKKKLLVEGNDDQHVILSLCSKFNIDETFEIIDCKGIEKLFDQIPLRIKEPEIQTIGVIIDADSDIILRWSKLKQIFNQEDIILPDSLPQHGLIFKVTHSITIGIWIMPNNNLNGMLEDFISFLVPNDDQLMPLINENLNNIESKSLNKYKSIHKSKAIIHSWLAIQEDPGTPMGLSITKRYLTAEKEICLILVNWLKELFRQ